MLTYWPLLFQPPHADVDNTVSGGDIGFATKTHNFVIPAGHMVPLSAETGGRLDGAFSKFLKVVVTSGLDFGELPLPVWTKETRALFASRLRSAHVTTSYAIARCVANALIYGSKTIARYPVCEAVGLVDI